MLEGLQAGQILLADRAYDSNALREAMTAQGVWMNIRPTDHRLDPPVFSHGMNLATGLPYATLPPQAPIVVDIPAQISLSGARKGFSWIVYVICSFAESNRYPNWTIPTTVSVVATPLKAPAVRVTISRRQ